MGIRQWIIDLLSRGLGRQCSEQEIEHAKMVGIFIDAEARVLATAQARCTHKKGGVWTRKDGKIVVTQGSSNQYAVIKHQHMNGDIWVNCIRCGRKWKPPVKSDYPTERKFYKAIEEYEEALSFPTNNATSTSLQFAFRLNGSMDAGHEFVRKQLANS